MCVCIYMYLKDAMVEVHTDARCGIPSLSFLQTSQAKAPLPLQGSSG